MKSLPAPALVAAAVFAAFASGCVINSDRWPRPRDLTPGWRIDKTRILGIRADPPEARPGDTVTFEALFAAPPDALPDQTVLWLACPVDDEGNGFGCLTDLGNLDLETADPAALAELGFIGFETYASSTTPTGGLPPTYAVPPDLLDGLSEEERLEGRYVLVQLLAFPTELLEQSPDAVQDIDFSVVLSAYKRLVVSESPTPNHNPEIGAFTVDGHPIPRDAPVSLEPEQLYEIGIALPEGAIETYRYTTRAGAVEERVEEPYASWYATGGELFEEVTLWPRIDASWQAPEAPEAGLLHVVLRDRRGGMSWYTQAFGVAPP